MVAKESKLIVDERYKEQFHLFYCRVQSKAQELAKLFNETVANTPVLGPRPPSITFLDCSIYEYTNAAGVRCGVLVENFLRGRFTKFNFNNGVAHTVDPGGASDFVQAFSHWVYETTKQKMIVCGLQGVFDCHDCLEPIFRLTDPAIYSRSRHGRSVYGRKDLGRNGIRSFCMSHCCNRVCSALKLPSLK